MHFILKNITPIHKSIRLNGYFTLDWIVKIRVVKIRK